ncbi:MAG TPA: hypothetical protein VFL57_22315, partial [Bryobacteraceae bacterium]|nr:hypothetical protein [Bryobacteraceae bacterium]
RRFRRGDIKPVNKTARSPPQNVVRAVHGDTVQPRAELPRLIDFTEVAVKLQQNLLRDIRGIINVANQAPRHPEYGPFMQAYNLLESIEIPTFGAGENVES